MVNTILYANHFFCLFIFEFADAKFSTQAVTALKKASKQDRVRNELLALPEMSRIKLRVSAGVFEVSLVRVVEERKSVEVLWDGGIRREFSWNSIVWGKTGDNQQVGQKPSVMAEQREHECIFSSFPSFPPLSLPSPTSSLSPSPTYPLRDGEGGGFLSEPPSDPELCQPRKIRRVVLFVAR